MRRHWPQLDGIRGVAIFLVVAYHLGYLDSGWLGVDIFFVLSGYLITGILSDPEGSVRSLGAFWGNRARRLLPAVLALLVALSLYAWAGGPGLVPAQLRGPALATLFYVANWQQIASSHGYFAQFTALNPIQQTWSLSIEEQFYLVWPLVLAALTLAVRSRGDRRWQLRLCLLTSILVICSAVWMGIVAHWWGPNRAYLGTDSRAWELLLGGVAAMLWPLNRPAVRLRRWSTLTSVGVVCVGLGLVTAAGPPWWIWDGGLVAISAGAALVIVGCIRAPEAPIARLLVLRPIRWLGVISYSLYLWHWPVIVLMNSETTGLAGWRLLSARVVSMVGVSCLSFYLIERPLRWADWSALQKHLHVPVAGGVSLGIAAAIGVILIGTVGPPLAETGSVSLQSSATSASSDFAHVNLPPAAPGHPYRTWILGDSVMEGGSPGITAALQATKAVSVVDNTSSGGWGLTTDPNWATEVHETLTTYRPQIVIGTWSWDGRQALAHPAAYRALLWRFLSTLLAPGDGVLLVVLPQFPQTGPNIFLSGAALSRADWVRQTEREVAWNTIAKQVVNDFPGRAVFLPTQQVFAPRGRFYVWLKSNEGRWLRARMVDSIHLCPYGAALLGALVLDDLTPVLKLPAASTGWEAGSWTTNSGFDQPPGSCPNDEPPSGYRGFAVPRVRT